MGRRLKLILAITVAVIFGLIITASTEKGGAAIVNAAAPSSSYSLEADISYGEHPRMTIDLYRAADPKEAAPVLMFIHGGGWHRGDKSMYKFMAAAFTQAGYDIALPNYRLYPEIIYPEFLYDSASAVAKLAVVYPERPIVLIGHSAGAYNSLMMGFVPEYLQARGIEPCYTLRGIVSLAGPTGAFPMTDHPYTEIFPQRLQGDDAALAHIKEPVPPLLLISGDKDKSVNYRNSVELGSALEDRNAARVIIYKNLSHIDVISQFSRLFDYRGSVKEDVLDFVDTLPEDMGDGYCR